MNHLLNALLSCPSSPKQSSHPVTDDLRTDINWQLLFLSHYNGVFIIPSDVAISSLELFANDASLTGCGAVSFGKCFHREFPEFILSQALHIVKQNCSRLSVPSSCGLQSYEVFTFHCSLTTLPVFRSFHLNMPPTVSCSPSYKNSGCSLPCITSN